MARPEQPINIKLDNNPNVALSVKGGVRFEFELQNSTTFQIKIISIAENLTLITKQYPLNNPIPSIIAQKG